MNQSNTHAHAPPLYPAGHIKVGTEVYLRSKRTHLSGRKHGASHTPGAFLPRAFLPSLFQSKHREWRKRKHYQEPENNVQSVSKQRVRGCIVIIAHQRKEAKAKYDICIILLGD